MKRENLFLMILCLCMIFLFSACGRELPPDDGSPEPEPLDGVFASEYGSLTFNGDGRSIVIDLSDELPPGSGLPSGKSEGTYVFLFRNEEWRYDKAETFRVTVGDESYSLRNAVGATGSDAITVTMANGETVTFEKATGQR